MKQTPGVNQCVHSQVPQNPEPDVRPLVAVILASIPKKKLVEIVAGRINERSIRRWRAGKHPPPNWVVAAVAAYLEKEAEARAVFAEALRDAPPRILFVPRPKPKNVRAGAVEPAPLAEG